MKISIQKLPKSKIELTIEVPAPDFEPYLEKAISFLSEDLKIAGFRPGKIPREIAKKELGTSKIFEKAAKIAIQESYPKAILENKIQAIGMPKVQIIKIAPKNPLIYKAEVAIMPEVKLPDYKEIAKSSKINPKNLEVSEKEVEDSLKWLQKSRAKKDEELPSLDDNFASQLGNFENLTALKQSIKEEIRVGKARIEKERVKEEIIEKIADASETETPEILIEYQIEEMIENFKKRTEEMGLKFEDYLKEIKKTEDKLKLDFKEEAEKRIKITLCLQEIAKEEKIEVSEEEIKEKINEVFKKYPDIKTAQKEVDLNKLKEYYKTVIRNEKTFQVLESFGERKRT